MELLGKIGGLKFELDMLAFQILRLVHQKDRGKLMSQRRLTHLFDVAVETRERFGSGGNHARLVKAHDSHKNILRPHNPFRR